MVNVVWKLGVPSSGFLREAQLFQPGYKSWCLWWISETSEGGGRNEALVFTGVESLKRTDFLAYTPDLINETYDTLVDLGETSFLGDVVTNLKVRMNAADLRHFAISFDAGPLFEFIARGYEFNSSFDVSVVQSDLKQRTAAGARPLSDK